MEMHGTLGNVKVTGVWSCGGLVTSRGTRSTRNNPVWF